MYLHQTAWFRIYFGITLAVTLIPTTVIRDNTKLAYPFLFLIFLSAVVLIIFRGITLKTLVDKSLFVFFMFAFLGATLRYLGEGASNTFLPAAGMGTMLLATMAYKPQDFKINPRVINNRLILLAFLVLSLATLRIGYGGMMTALAGVAIPLLLLPAFFTKRYGLLFVCLPFVVLPLLLTNYSTMKLVYLVLLTLLLLYSIFTPQKALKIIYTAIISIVLLSPILATVLIEFEASKSAVSSDKLDTADNSTWRLYVLSLAADEFMQKPIFGDLFNRQTGVNKEFIDPETGQYSSGAPVHNDVLDVALQGGIFFTSLFLIGYIGTIFWALKNQILIARCKLSREWKALNISLAVSLTTGFIALLFNPTLLTVYQGIWTFFYWGLLMMINKQISYMTKLQLANTATRIPNPEAITT